MFWQMKLSPKSGDRGAAAGLHVHAADFHLFCYKYASALALYWTVQNIFSIVQLYLTRNQNLLPSCRKWRHPPKEERLPFSL